MGKGFDVGVIQKHNRKLIYGIGDNDFDGVIIYDGMLISEYRLWHDMIMRCYSEKYHKKQPTYKECVVEEYFHKFTNFYDFIHTLKGYNSLDDKDKPFQLDKDILSKNGKCYHRDHICFVPQEINKFNKIITNKSSNLLIGVSFKNNKFISQISLDNKIKHLGSFKTEIEAHLAYKEAKEQQAKVLAERWKDNIDERVYNALMNYKVEITD